MEESKGHGAWGIGQSIRHGAESMGHSVNKVADIGNFFIFMDFSGIIVGYSLHDT
jgi:hypothetical protein